MTEPSEADSIVTQRINFLVRRLAIALACFVVGFQAIIAFAGEELFTAAAKGRTVIDFDRDWKFTKDDSPRAMMPGFDDSTWRTVTLPHDWSIEGPLGPEYASGTGYAPGGIGWYRKTFRLDETAKTKLVAVEFDGIYNHSEVWINGQLVGGRPYGYSSFECDLTPFVKFGGAPNVLVVRVDHSRFADSRWYTGSGIYRDVRLRLNDTVRMVPHGIYVTTPKVADGSAIVHIETEIQNDSPSDVSVQLTSELSNPRGAVVGTRSKNIDVKPGINHIVIQEMKVKRPIRWTLDNPLQYTLRSSLSFDAGADEVKTSFGIRTIRFDPDQGFFLNGTPTKIKGVCIHHDAGGLGAAVPKKALERRLRLLKDLGVNAIRTSHNPPAPELIEICDRLGLLVKDEAFDEFAFAKNKWVGGWNGGEPSHFGYSEDFREWSIRDIQDMVRRDRNHPSIIMWSIGNEIDYANDPYSHPVLGAEYRPQNPSAQNLVACGEPLVKAVHELDQTRPVTAAMATVAMSDAVGFPEVLDISGYNYQEARYAADHAKFPKRVIFGSENHHDFGAWQAVRTNNYISGQFLWTGIDYLGEAGQWPNHANGSGLLDLCGFKKPLAWFRQSLWSDAAMVYIFVSPWVDRGSSAGATRRRGFGEENWNWPSDSTVTVRCYTTCPDVELMLNGRSLGIKHRSEAVDGTLSWTVPFEPGIVTAIGSDRGRKVSEFSLRTAGPAKRIELFPDTRSLTTDGKDISHVEFRVVDTDGTRVPNAENKVTFSVEGPGKILCTENADLNSTEDYRSNTHSVFHGRGLLILQSTLEKGAIKLKAESPDLETATIEWNSH